MLDKSKKSKCQVKAMNLISKYKDVCQNIGFRFITICLGIHNNNIYLLSHKVLSMAPRAAIH